MIELMKNSIVVMTIAAVTSLITVCLVLRRFRRAQMLEQKVSAYGRIIRALHGMQQHCRWYTRQVPDMNHSDVTPERIQEFRDAVAEIERASDEGFLFVGPFFAAELKTVRREIADGRGTEDVAHLCQINVAIEAFLMKVRNVPGMNLGQPF